MGRRTRVRPFLAFAQRPRPEDWTLPYSLAHTVSPSARHALLTQRCLLEAKAASPYSHPIPNPIPNPIKTRLRGQIRILMP
eukprot:364835-Chlamydomonas_euryale.AAC.3